MTEQEQQQQTPVKDSRKACNLWTIISLTVFVAAGLAGVLFVTLPKSSGTRGSDAADNSLRGSSSQTCPKNVNSLDEYGMMQEEQGTEFLDTLEAMPPSCVSKEDPMQGLYYEWEASAEGQVKLAAWTVMVDLCTCECITTESTFDVKAGQRLRVWTPADEVQPLEFIPKQLVVAQDNCPTTVTALDEYGTIEEGVFEDYDTAAVVMAPSCASDQDPMQGLYFEWTAPADGQAELAAWTLLANGCECITTESTFDVKEGQVFRVWAPLDQIQPIHFTPN